MREILFRGKLKNDNGDYEKNQWVYGDYTRLREGKRLMSYIYGYGEVIPETVGQYTGLEDKNGIKIFEGDIVAGALHWQERRKNGIVAFRNGSFGLLWYRGEIEQFNPFTSMCNVEYEVIGNVQENPELMRGEEE